MAIDIKKIEGIDTPFYYYDRELLERTLATLKAEMGKADNYHLHYAVKANTNPEVIKVVASYGFGADCVTGGEVNACLAAGFPASGIVYAGVGKTDWEIRLGLEKEIAYFNVESIPELEVINELAGEMHKVARVSFRINPNVGAHTHANITTGLAENKFGIDMVDLERVLIMAQEMENVECVGLHFHIGSQILEMDDFEALCHRINELQDRIEAAGLVCPTNINVGGGLGIDYEEPDQNPVPNFADFFRVYRDNLCLRPGQQLHFELGRAVVGQMGSLITRVLYVKDNSQKKFVIVDAGFPDLIRPALYGAYHRVDNLTPHEGTDTYDVVGPICESSDIFVGDYTMPVTRRGDLLALRSAGAYGEIMASGYNTRPFPKGYLI